MRIKRLYTFMLQTFLPLFAMTFFIVLFIVLMQFLWRFIDDLVGKGLGFGIIAELFFYAALSMVPMALPLAVLLASLMTFGNLGEKFELTAMKASGMSLVKVMKPLIVLIACVAVGAFFFQNDVLPKVQVKMWTLLFSMRQKSPELEIPEGVFYDQIPGYNLFVGQKDQDTGELYDVMIYDVKQGGDNATILLADSARLAMAPDMSHLYLHLQTGEQFENLRQSSGYDRNVPFRREEFQDKEILIPFDANFNRLDEGGMRDQYVGKNTWQLQATIDSVNLRLDSIGHGYAEGLRQGYVPLVSRYLPSLKAGSSETPVEEIEKKEEEMMRGVPSLSVDSLLQTMSAEKAMDLIKGAQGYNRSRRNDLEFKALTIEAEKVTIRRHGIEFYKKFTLSVACLVFFFIGAPLGAIIRKGGLGTPLVISILLFLFYYVIDNTGYKMARDGRWPVWAGMWLSSVVLAPLGVYVTWKAMNDSSVFDKDAYMNFFRRLFGVRSDRHVDYKEVVMHDVSDSEALAALRTLREESSALAADLKKAAGYRAYWRGAFPDKEFSRFVENLDNTVDYLTNSRNTRILGLLPKFPVLRRLAVYRLTRHRRAGEVMSWFFPLSVPVWLYARRTYRNLLRELDDISRICGEVSE